MLSAGPVCSCAHFFVPIAHETAGAARTRSSLRPHWARASVKLRAHRAARRRNCIHSHCERSEAIHCHLLHGKMDCFASLAMTEKAVAGDLSAVAQRAKADP